MSLRPEDQLAQAYKEGFYSPDDGSWQVWSEYRIEAGVLRGGGELVRNYLPAAFPQIATDLAKLWEGDERSVLRFAHRWGGFGYKRLMFLDERIPWPEATMDDSLAETMYGADPLHWIWAHARGVQLITSLTYYLNHDSHEDLKALIEAIHSRHMALLMSEKRGTEPDITDKMMWKVPPFGDRHLLKEYVYFGPSLEDPSPRSLARRIVLEIVNFNLPMVRHRLTTWKDSDKPILGQSSGLLGTVYWHLAQMITEATGLARCEECGQFFPQMHGRQRFCPPDPSVGRDAESLCAKRARTRRFEQKRRGSNG